MGDTDKSADWKNIVNQWAQIVLLMLTIIGGVVVVEHRLTTLEDTTKQQATSSEKAAALSSLAVESVIQWVQIQATTPPKQLKQKGEDFIKEIQAKQKKISQLEIPMDAGTKVYEREN